MIKKKDNICCSDTCNDNHRSSSLEEEWEKEGFIDTDSEDDEKGNVSDTESAPSRLFLSRMREEDLHHLSSPGVGHSTKTSTNTSNLSDRQRSWLNTMRPSQTLH